MVVQLQTLYTRQEGEKNIYREMSTEVGSIDDPMKHAGKHLICESLKM